jgi:hypothetical protein
MENNRKEIFVGRKIGEEANDELTQCSGHTFYIDYHECPMCKLDKDINRIKPTNK